MQGICKAKGGCASQTAYLLLLPWALWVLKVCTGSTTGWIIIWEKLFWKAVLHNSSDLQVIGDLGGWGYILEQCYCMHLISASIRRTEASSSSFFFFILPTDHMLYISKGALPEKQDYSHLREWGFVAYGWFCASLHTATSRALRFFQTGDNSCVHPYTNSSSAFSCCSRNWDYWHSSMRRAIFLKLLIPPYWRSWMPSMLYVTFLLIFAVKFAVLIFAMQIIHRISLFW